MKEHRKMRKDFRLRYGTVLHGLWINVMDEVTGTTCAGTITARVADGNHFVTVYYPYE